MILLKLIPRPNNISSRFCVKRASRKFSLTNENAAREVLNYPGGQPCAAGAVDGIGGQSYFWRCIVDGYSECNFKF